MLRNKLVTLMVGAASMLLGPAARAEFAMVFHNQAEPCLYVANLKRQGIGQGFRDLGESGGKGPRAGALERRPGDGLPQYHWADGQPFGGGGGILLQHTPSNPGYRRHRHGCVLHPRPGLRAPGGAGGDVLLLLRHPLTADPAVKGGRGRTPWTYL